MNKPSAPWHQPLGARQVMGPMCSSPVTKLGLCMQFETEQLHSASAVPSPDR